MAKDIINIPLVYRNVIKGRYLINKNGEVFCLWRLNKNRGKNYYDPPIRVSSYLGQSGTSSMISLMVGVNKTKAFYLHTIMAKVFNLERPDNFNQYILYYKDGDLLNNRLNNIGYKKLTQYKKYGLKYESVNVVKNGELVAKSCSYCGKTKSINNFQVSARHNGKLTLKNKCVQCVSKLQWERIKSDPKHFARHRENQRRSQGSERGKKYHREYDKKQRENLDDAYVKKVIQKAFNYKLQIKHIPKWYIEAKRIRIKTIRLIKQKQKS